MPLVTLSLGAVSKDLDTLSKYKKAMQDLQLTRSTYVTRYFDDENSEVVAAGQLIELQPIFDEVLGPLAPLKPVVPGHAPSMAQRPPSPPTPPTSTPLPVDIPPSTLPAAAIQQSVLAPPPTPAPNPAIVAKTVPPITKPTETPEKATPVSPKKSSPAPVLIGAVAVAGVVGLALLSAQAKKPNVPAPSYPISRYEAPRHEKVMAVGLNVRTGPGTNYAKSPVDPLKMGDLVTEVGEAYSASGMRWVYIQLPDGSGGFVSGKMLGPSPTADAVPVAAPTPAPASAPASNPALASTPATAPTAAPPPANQQLAMSSPPALPTTAELAAEQFALSYMGKWSDASDPAGYGIDHFYADQVNFYGSLISHQSLMSQKTAFAKRWPNRNYVVRAQTLAVQCASDGSCMVNGVVDWHVSNQFGDRTASGTADFTMGIRDQMIVYESGRVLNRS